MNVRVDDCKSEKGKDVELYASLDVRVDECKSEKREGCGAVCKYVLM